jgi:hypothetical protein
MNGGRAPEITHSGKLGRVWEKKRRKMKEIESKKTNFLPLFSL